MTEAVYIHIPFCRQICSYCDFCKVIKSDKWVNSYLDALEKEINDSYKGELIKTLYIGGGTPSSLSILELEKLFEILSVFNLDVNCEITFECNCEDLNLELLEFLKDKINRLSVGVQTFNDELIKLLGRKEVNIDNIILAKKYFNNINIDLMYGFNVSSDVLKSDVLKILELDITHISTYNLILEEHTKLYISGYVPCNDDDYHEKFINDILAKNGYEHYEISNYSKKGFESKHNLTYWNNGHYYGFGLGASGYIDNVRYENTHNLSKYISSENIRDEYTLDLNETLQNEFILGFRKISGINRGLFKEKYGFDVLDILIIKDLLDEEKLILEENNICINPKYLYLSNEILVNFIDCDIRA